MTGRAYIRCGCGNTIECGPGETIDWDDPRWCEHIQVAPGVQIGRVPDFSLIAAHYFEYLEGSRMITVPEPIVGDELAVYLNHMRITAEEYRREGDSFTVLGSVRDGDCVAVDYLKRVDQ